MKNINKYILTFVFPLFSIITLYSQNTGNDLSITNEQRTIAKIDLTSATGDHKLLVEVEPPIIKSSTIRYYMPKIVPGTYTINNFGRFVSGMKAYDIDGNELAVDRIDTNTWDISNADKLRKITYKVEDTYHSDSSPAVFEPTGLDIDSGKVFMLNNYCLVGYFEGYKDMPYSIAITKPEGFYGATSLTLEKTENNTDYYFPKNYFDLHDNPMMYAVPDTASTMVYNTRILLSVYSPNGKVNAEYLKKHATDLFESQGKYLGGELPTDRYTVLVCLYTGVSKSHNAGALEHYRSTMFCYPEIEKEEFVQPFKDVVSHEFFHIVTPLGIHSYQIGNFDFINPEMSKHLWLYEGSTEYYAHHSQVKSGLITPDEFFSKMQQKIFISTQYYMDTLPFTELSKGALDKYKIQYFNVYQKGALISMCLDLYLLKLSEGKYGLQNLKSELGKKYGPDKSFEDDELFDVITEMTYPEIRDFFRNYVEGSSRLPYKQFLNYAGYDYYETYENEVPAMVGASLEYGAGGSLNVIEVGEFGKELKLKKGDLLFSFNGKEINPHNFQSISGEFERNAKVGDEVSIVVLRKNKSGNYVKKTLRANTYIVKRTDQFVILPMKKPTPEQLKIRKAWINQ